jgi:hypothetical protein
MKELTADTGCTPIWERPQDERTEAGKQFTIFCSVLVATSRVQDIHTSGVEDTVPIRVHLH